MAYDDPSIWYMIRTEARYLNIIIKTTIHYCTSDKKYKQDVTRTKHVGRNCLSYPLKKKSPARTRDRYNTNLNREKPSHHCLNILFSRTHWNTPRHTLGTIKNKHFHLPLLCSSDSPRPKQMDRSTKPKLYVKTHFLWDHSVLVRRKDNKIGYILKNNHIQGCLEFPHNSLSRIICYFCATTLIWCYRQIFLVVSLVSAT